MPKEKLSIKLEPANLTENEEAFLAAGYVKAKSKKNYDYLIANCQQTWANQGNVNVIEDEHAVLFTGYNKDEIARLGVDTSSHLGKTCNN